MLLNLKRLIVAVGVLGGTVAVVFGLGASQAASNSAPVSTPSWQETSPYGVVRQPASPTDDVSNWRVTPDRMANDHADLGLKPSGTRVVRRDSSSTLAVIPTDKTACIASYNSRSGSAGLSCPIGEDPTTAMIRYGAATGLVPDGVRTVTFRLTNGTSVTQAVKDNLWEAPQEAESASFVVNGEDRRVELMPLSSLPKNASVKDGVVSTQHAPPAADG